MRNLPLTAIILNVWLAVLVDLPCGVLAEDAADSIPRLAGIVMLPDLKLALLQAAPPLDEARYQLLAE